MFHGKALYCGVALAVAMPSFGARIKDIASVKGMRDNQLTGYGLVVGLAGSGDSGVELTASSLGQALKGLGVDSRSLKVDSKNVAAVFVSAVLPPFARNGSRLDVAVSSIGSASSLEGGVLMMTALRGPDGQVYAMAQGKIQIEARTGKGTSQAKHLVSGLVPGGGLLEQEVQYNWADLKELRYQLHTPDFTTAARVAHRINEELSGRYALPEDAGSVQVIIPYGFEATPVELIARIESIDVEADRAAKVVVNPRTGTVVLGESVRILPVAIAHNNLSVEVKDTRGPASDGAGDTLSVGSAQGNKKHVMLVNGSASIAELVGGLNELGASADDLMSVLKSLKASGALLAELEIQ